MNEKQKTKIIKIDEDTHTKLKIDAAALGISMRDYIKKLAFMRD